jgi:hypothetical protein
MIDNCGYGSELDRGFKPEIRIFNLCDECVYDLFEDII